MSNLIIQAGIPSSTPLYNNAGEQKVILVITPSGLDYDDGLITLMDGDITLIEVFSANIINNTPLKLTINTRFSNGEICWSSGSNTKGTINVAITRIPVTPIT